MPAPHAPLNRVHPVKFTPVIAKCISLGYPQGVQPGWNPWRYFTGACPVKYLFLLHRRSLPSSGFRPRNSEMPYALCLPREMPFGIRNCLTDLRFTKEKVSFAPL
jgi:hypothetical protein